MAIDEGVIQRTNDIASVRTKRKLLDECDLLCIVSLHSGVLMNAGTGCISRRNAL